MAPKLPGKFDDISKTASSLLGDDFQCKDFQFKAKQTTNLDGATSELTVDLFKAGDCKTPTKLSFKFPKPFSFATGFAVDKFDLDAGGKAKVECSASKALHGVDGLKIEVKSDLNFNALGAPALTFASTYTGLADASVKLETKQSNPADFTGECLYGYGSSVIGLKLKGLGCPDAGVNFQSGDIFASVFAKNTFSEFTAHAHYKVNDIKAAATFQQGGKNSGAWSVGAATAVGEINAKAKLDSSMTMNLAFKKALAKGTTFNGGVSYGINDGKVGYGAKVSIE